MDVRMRSCLLWPEASDSDANHPYYLRTRSFLLRQADQAIPGRDNLLFVRQSDYLLWVVAMY